MFSKAIVRPPSVNFAEGLTTISGAAPNYARALRQHTAYCEALERCGLTLTRLESDERYPDSTFVEDTAVIVDALPNGRATAPHESAPAAILTRPGAPSRSGEVNSVAKTLSEFFPELPSIREPARLMAETFAKQKIIFS